MPKQKIKNSRIAKRYLNVLVVGVVIGASVFVGTVVQADQFDEQIRALQQENSAKRQISNQLAAQASSYQDAVDRLSTQINSIRQAILDYQHQSDLLQQQIEAQQAELVRQKQVLGQNIKAMYLEGQISTLEILASSKDLSEFVDKQQYRNSVQTKVKTTVEKITDLKLQLQVKQREIQGLIKDQQAQQALLDASLSQQNDLLNLTVSQKAAKDAEIKSNNAQIASLRTQQLAINRRIGGNDIAGDPNHGGYPAYWDKARQDSLLDSWGMLNRECVSYTAWKVYEAYGPGSMPYWGGIGNANQWPANARAYNIPTGSTPKAGSVAISMSGFYGHSMWVESVNPDGTFNVSQYNKYWNGTYSETYNVNPAGLIFIYFGE
ncbi:CHAP domain-containing protein [Candidatus Saccharibacteria bacterium]|nr:CHAP domain-containing protein [Candidatus Saccharibacteria bacterium]